MPNEKEFVEGLRVWDVNDTTPEWIILKLGIDREELIKFLESKTDKYVNVDVCRSRGDNLYAQVNNWKPSNARIEGEDDLPF